MIGQTLQHYRILRQLGAGGMGIVYEAEDTRLGRHVALKFLPEGLNVTAGAAEAGERFEREARIASSLNHPNICTIHDIGVHEGRRFIVMELLDGDSLRNRIHGAPIPIDQVIDVGCQIADALEAAHAKGIVHRDVKPANIFITKRGQAKLLDFGVAKPGSDHADHSADETRAAADALTMPGTAVGSVNYMSPEQARGEEIDGRTDLFSLGIVLYEMATGKQAFSGQTTAVVFDAILNRDPVPVRQLNPDVPEDLARVISRALEKDRKLRYQTAADLGSELSRIRRDSSGRATAATSHVPVTSQAAAPAVERHATLIAPPMSATSRPRARWSMPVVLGVPAVLVIAVAGFWFWSSTRTPAFTERDLIVVSDFTNTTGDTVFDDALKQAVSVQLQQTPYVTLVGDQQIQRTLKLMQRKPDERVTGAVAREVCQRAGGKATVDGSIAPLGSSYVITLAVRNCQTGESIAQQQSQASNKESVLKTIGGTVTDLRKHLGESLASVARYDAPAEATTSSLEALQAYGLGLKTRVVKGDEQSIPFFKQAIERDPNFALASAKLSVVDSNIGNQDDAKTYGQQAYGLRDRVSEYERLYIIWNYASHVTHDDKLTGDTLELMTTSYPRDFAARNNLGVFHMEHGRLDEALKQYQAAIEIAPSEPLAYGNATTVLFGLNRLTEGLDMASKALQFRPDPQLAIARWTNARLGGDPRAAEFEAAARKLAPAYRVAQADAELALWDGKLAAYQTLFAQATSGAREANDTNATLQDELQVAFTLAVFRGGAYLSAVRKYTDPPHSVYIMAPAAEILAFAGDMAGARAALARLDKVPSDSLQTRMAVAIARAYVKAADGHGAEAAADLEALATQMPRDREIHSHIATLLSKAGDADGAVTQYRQVVDGGISLGTNTLLSIARLQLGELLLKRGDTAGAKAQFDVLAAQWKNADVDFKPAVQLKTDLAKLGK